MQGIYFTNWEFPQYLSTVLDSLQGISWPICVDLTQYWQQESSSLTRA